MRVVYGHPVVEASGRALLPQRREQAAVARRPQRAFDARAIGGRLSRCPQRGVVIGIGPARARPVTPAPRPHR